MAVTIKEIVEAFGHLFANLHDREFRKTLPLNDYGERELLPLVRVFLLGWFGHCAPEAKCSLPGGQTGRGSLDFVVGDTAIELAVRRPRASKASLSSVTNADEARKLMKHDGPAVLVLYDFSKTPFSEEQIERYRDWPSLGKGNHKKSAFNIAYFYRSSFRPIHTGVIRKNIRVS